MKKDLSPLILPRPEIQIKKPWENEQLNFPLHPKEDTGLRTSEATDIKTSWIILSALSISDLSINK